MPYKSDKIKITGTSLDKRRKLSSIQKKAILDLSSKGYSQRKLAEIFGCSRWTIENLLSPPAHRSPPKKRPASYWTECKRRYRARKHKLYKDGKLGAN